MTEQTSSSSEAVAAGQSHCSTTMEHNLEEIQQKTVSTWFGNKVVLFGEEGSRLSCEEEEAAKRKAALESSSSEEAAAAAAGDTPKEQALPQTTTTSSLNGADKVPNIYTGWIRQRPLLTTAPSIHTIRNWQFDVLAYTEQTLVQIVEAMFHYYDLYTIFAINQQAMNAYIVETMNKHHAHLYHNWYHAVSAMHSSFLFLTLAGADEYLQKRDILAILLGALVHDVEHTGNNNDFEKKRQTELALLYPQSVLEMHSITQAFEMLDKDPKLDILQGVSEEDTEYIRCFAREAILATDVANHGKTTEALAALVMDSEKRKEEKDEGGEGLPLFNKDDPESRLLLGRAIVHAADIFNPVHGDFVVAKDWCCRISVEFSLQALEEEKHGLPVTSFMTGLETPEKVAKMQVNFMNFMVTPFFRVLGQVMPKTMHLVENALVNTECYKKIVEDYENGVVRDSSGVGTTSSSSLNGGSGAVADDDKEEEEKKGI